MTDVAAALNVRYLRGLRLASVRVLAVASLPFWAQAYGARPPGWLAWLASLASAASLALAVGYGLIEHRWRRRARRDHHPPWPAVLHVREDRGHQAGAWPWWALGAASLLPWAAASLGRPLPGAQALATGLAAFSILTLLMRFFSTSTTMRR